MQHTKDLTDEQWVVEPLKGMSSPPTTLPNDGAYGPTPRYTCRCPVPQKAQMLLCGHGRMTNKEAYRERADDESRLPQRA